MQRRPREYCALRHKREGRTTLEVIVFRESCRNGRIHSAWPSAFQSVLDNLVVRTENGWYWAGLEQEDGSTRLNPWALWVQDGPDRFVTLWEYLNRMAPNGACDSQAPVVTSVSSSAAA